jgi:hypothetical protein
METNIAKLITLLTDSERAMEELLLSLVEEQRCIVGLDLKQLDENVGRKEEATARLTELQQMCNELICRAGAELGHLGIRSLSSLIAVVTAAEQADLRLLQQRQVRLAMSLERQFGLNRKILVNSIGMVQNSMSLFGRMLGGCDTYGVQGRINSGRATGSVLRREM